MKIAQRQTAIESYYSVIEMLPQKRRVVYDAIEELGSACNLDIAYHLQQPINRITPRTNELVKLELVEEDCRKITPRTGRKVIYWRVKKDSGQQSLL